MAEAQKILVVEDNDFVRMQIVHFLSEDGYETIEATDGQVALDLVLEDKAQFDMAVLDIRMEPLDGFEFLRALRGQNIDLPVVLVTGDTTPDILNEAGRWGVAAVLMKPVQRERLIKVVERTLLKSKS